MNRLSYEKAREDLILQISQMYYLGQVTAEQIILIKANITRLEELRDITQAFYDNGMAMEVDLPAEHASSLHPRTRRAAGNQLQEL